MLKLKDKWKKGGKEELLDQFISVRIRKKLPYIKEALSVILDKKVSKEEIENIEQREKLIYEANELLEDLDENFYVNIREISFVSPGDFE